MWCKSEKFKQQVSVRGKRQGPIKKVENTPCARLYISKIELFRTYINILKKFNDKLCIFEVNTDFDNIIYCEAKMNSIIYQQAWDLLKRDYFRIWSNKPTNQNMFQID